MAKILVFKTASETVMQQLLDGLKENNEVIILTQTSAIDQYIKKYPMVELIDIKKESFYDIESQVLSKAQNIYFDQVYIPFTGGNAFRFGNIIEIVEKLNYQKAFFYNCNGEVSKIPPKRKSIDLICKWYLDIIRLINF